MLRTKCSISEAQKYFLKTYDNEYSNYDNSGDKKLLPPMT